MKIYNNPEAVVHESLPLINVWGPQATHSLAVVTKDMKYIFWNFGAEGMEPTEELYDTAKDPLELNNLVRDPQYNMALKSMHAYYDRQLEEWRANAVAYNDYRRFGVVFDRRIGWKSKTRYQSKH